MPVDVQFSEEKWLTFGIGPNNAGKSNVLRVLEVFFQWVATRRDGVAFSRPYFALGREAQLEITAAFTRERECNEYTVLLKLFAAPTHFDHVEIALRVDGEESTRHSFAEGVDPFSPGVVYAHELPFEDGGIQRNVPIRSHPQELRKRTVILRADDGLCFTSNYLLENHPKSHKALLSFIHHVSNGSHCLPVEELARSLSVTLVSVIHTLQQHPERLVPINELAAKLGVRFHVEGGRLLHSKLAPRAGNLGPLLPLTLASDGTIHALVLFYVLTSDADNFFLDEPGSKLHPSFHAKLRAQLAALAAQGRNVFVITHTPSLISPEHDRLLHFSWSAEGTRAHPLHQSRTIYEHAKSVHGRNLFFAEFVVLIEGPLDYGFFTALQRTADPTSSLGAVLNAVHFAVCHGTKNFVHALRLLRYLPTPWILLADADHLDGVCRKNTRQEADQKTSTKYALVHKLAEAKDGGKLVKELPLYSDWETVQPTVRSSELPSLQKGAMGQKLLSALEPLLNGAQFVDACQAELRRFARENLRSYIWQPVGNGAIEAALSIGKVRDRNPDYDDAWDRIATSVLQERQAWEQRHQPKAEPTPDQAEGNVEVVDPAPDQASTDAEAEPEAEEEAGLAGDDAGAEYADVLNFLSYLERMYHESVGKPHIWLPEAPRRDQRREADQHHQGEKRKREKGKEK